MPHYMHHDDVAWVGLILGTTGNQPLLLEVRLIMGGAWTESQEEEQMNTTRRHPSALPLDGSQSAPSIVDPPSFISGSKLFLYTKATNDTHVTGGEKVIVVCVLEDDATRKIMVWASIELPPQTANGPWRQLPGGRHVLLELENQCSSSWTPHFWGQRSSFQQNELLHAVYRTNWRLSATANCVGRNGEERPLSIQIFAI